MPPLHEDAPPPLQIIADSVQDGMQDNSQDVIDRFTNCLTFNDRQIHELEKCTRNQSNSQYWWDQRKGRITASHFHKVHTKMQTILRRRGNPVKTCVTPLIQELVDPVPLEKIPSLDWGKSNEHNAAAAFMKLEGVKHSHPKLLPCGLFILKSHPYIGATPDNIFTCKCCEHRICVEYKCPYSIREHDVSDSWDKTDFLEKVNDIIQLKRNHKYFTQITGQMAIIGTKQCYFVAWTTKGKPIIEKIQLDKVLWEKVLPNLILFFKSFVQNYLLGLNRIFICPICDKPCLMENEFELPEENSIECSQCALWFHWKCCDIVCNIADDFICLFCKDV